MIKVYPSKYMQLTLREFKQLDRDSQREAILNFTAPDFIYEEEQINFRIFRKEKV